MPRSSSPAPTSPAQPRSRSTALPPHPSPSMRTAQSLGGPVHSNAHVPVPAPVVTGLSPTTGPVGTRVLIAGNNFQDVTLVAFNGVPVPPSALSVEFPTQLTVMVSARATTGTVTV